MSETSLELSVIIITLDEEKNLARCLASLPPNCEIIVVDSHSQDETRDIAVRHGAKVVTRAFQNYQEQKNFALSLATKSWVLSLDADEQLTLELKQSILEVVNSADASPSKYRIKRQLVFMGKKLRYGRTTDYPLRLFWREGAVFEGKIHEQVYAPGKLKTLDGIMYHYSYQNLDDYFERFNRYTSAVARTHHERGKQPNFAALLLRPWWEFFSRYILRLGFLDGYPGYTYALCSSLYAFTKYAKLKEILESNQLTSSSS